LQLDYTYSRNIEEELALDFVESLEKEIMRKIALK
jgi:hypothetical protein